MAFCFVRSHSQSRLVVSPGLIHGFMARPLPADLPDTVEPVSTDVLVHDGNVLPINGGVEVIHTPGHSEGHCVFLSHRHSAAFLDDTAATLVGLREMPLNEHFGQAVMSLKKLASPDCGIACFAHGEPIKKGASRRFMKRWRGGR